jgi:cytochrome P450
LKLICIALFGRKVLSEDDEASLIDSVHTLESDLQRDMFRLLPPSPWAAVQQQRVRGKARESLAKILDRVAARAGGTSVLSALLSLQLSRSALRDELLTMLVAGYHTTASAAAWLFYCLAMHPELANRIACEAHATSDSAGEIRPSKLPQASTSLSFVKEVLRLYPAAWWTSRELKQDFEIAERTLRTGTTVIICPWHIHRDPRNHENPEKFSIDRSFAGPAYLPFGTGPRACVGMGVALLELQLIALELASAFEFRVASDSAPQPAAEILLTPPDVSLRMLVRNTRQSKKVA